MEGFFQDLEIKFTKKTRNLGNQWGCIAWEGYVDKYGYGVQNVRWPTVGLKKESAHRVAYMIRHKLSRDDMPRFDEKGAAVECSHLCHNKLCVNPDHILIENHALNQDRIHCKGQGMCSGAHVPHCLICKFYFLFIRCRLFTFEYPCSVILPASFLFAALKSLLFS